MYLRKIENHHKKH